VTKLTHAVILVVFILGAVPVSLILADPPAATAAPMWAQEPGPQLSDEEQRALDDKNAGRNYDKDAFKRAKGKLDTQEKFNGERNIPKRDNNNRRGGRRR